LVHVKDGKVTQVRGDPKHPASRGYICIKAKAQPQLIYHPDRLKFPMKRVGAKGSGQWERISWDEALDGIATSFTQVKATYGAECIATMHGTGPRSSTPATTLLAHALGSPNVVSTNLHICYAPSMTAGICTFGHSVMMEVGPDYLGAKCILIWGANPQVSHGPRGRDIIEAKQRGAKLIVIDPRRTNLARKADLWLQIRPGTDAALALAMINTLIEQELYDKQFVNRWCYGFDQLRSHIRSYTPRWAADLTWIPADLIMEATRVYAKSKPAAFHHRVAVEHNINSSQTLRAFNILIALTGNIDVPGGNLIPTPLQGYVRGQAIYGRESPVKLTPEVEQKRLGAEQYPLISGTDARTITFVHAALAVEAMLTSKPYPIKVLYCAGGNPVVNQQNVKRVWEALGKLSLLVVADFFMTPTAELADYVLPVAAWLERDECCDGMYQNCIAARQKVVEPVGECWDDMKIVVELVKRIPWANRRYLPWNTVEEFNDFRVRGLGMTFQEFKTKGYVTVLPQYRKYEDHGFDTPTKKVELYSTVLEKLGYDPLPRYIEPPESPISTPELLADYPLILISGGRYVGYFHSEGRQIPMLRKLAPDPEIEIHPATAERLAIKSGDWVWIETPRAKGEKVKLKAKVTTNIDPRVVHAAHAWWFPEKLPPEHGCFDSNINVVLSDNPPRDPICGSIPTRGTLCRIQLCPERIS